MKNNNNDRINKFIKKLNNRNKKNKNNNANIKYTNIRKKIKKTACFIIINIKLSSFESKINIIKKEKIKNFRTQTQYENFINLLKVDLYKYCGKLISNIKNKILFDILMSSKNDKLIDSIIDFEKFDFDKYYNYGVYQISKDDKIYENEMLEVEKVLVKSPGTINNNNSNNNKDKITLNLNKNHTEKNISKKKKSFFNISTYTNIIIFLTVFFLVIIFLKYRFKKKKLK